MFSVVNLKGFLLSLQVPLARSEGNLLELMERVCERMGDYGERTDPSTNRKSYIRVRSRTGEPMDLSEAALDSRVTSSLKFAVSFLFSLLQRGIISTSKKQTKKTQYLFPRFQFSFISD